MNTGDWADAVKFGRVGFPIRTCIVGPKKHYQPKMSEESIVVYESHLSEESEQKFGALIPSPPPSEPQETEISSDIEPIFTKLTRKLSNGTLSLPCSIRYEITKIKDFIMVEPNFEIILKQTIRIKVTRNRYLQSKEL